MPTFKTKEEYERWKTGKLKEDKNLINDEYQEKESVLKEQGKKQDKQIQNKKICKQIVVGFVTSLVVYFLSTFILSELILTESDRKHIAYLENHKEEIAKEDATRIFLFEKLFGKGVDVPLTPRNETNEFIKTISFWISVISFCFYMAFLSYIEKKNSKKKGKR